MYFNCFKAQHGAGRAGSAPAALDVSDWALYAPVCGRASARTRGRCERADPWAVRGLRTVGDARGRLAPQLLEAVVVARLRREDVHDDVEVIHQDPVGAARALDAPRDQ
jgi:hypothetical protein